MLAKKPEIESDPDHASHAQDVGMVPEEGWIRNQDNIGELIFLTVSIAKRALTL